MAYTPINWQTGDTITADKLNKMDNGWGVESTQLFSETVTTADNNQGFHIAQLAYSQFTTADSLIVTFDGTEYVCRNNSSFPGEGAYGAPYNGETSGFDFSEFPFNLYTYGGEARITTQTAGEHTIAAVASTLQTSADFDKARGWGRTVGELFDEDVTTTSKNGLYGAQLAYVGTIDSDSITVTFDGTEYTCPRIDALGGHYYGGFSTSGPDFTNYPFAIESQNGENRIYTETASEHNVIAVGQITMLFDKLDALVYDIALEAAHTLPVLLKVATGVTTWQQLTNVMLLNGLAYAVVDDGTGGAQAWLFVNTYIGTDDYYYATAIGVNPRTTSFNAMSFKAASADSSLELA